MPRVTSVAGLLAAAAVVAASTGSPAEDKGTEPAKTEWTILFRTDDPSVWDKDAKNEKGQQVAIPVRHAPKATKYLRLRRMDTGDAQILPLTHDQLLNGTPPTPETGYWWNGTAKEEYQARHLGIVQGPRYKFPVTKNTVCVMAVGWDCFAGSGFCHKAYVDDRQYYCWKGKEIPRTEFEVAVTPGPLSPEEAKSLVGRP
jgi:hypothetical protein